MYRSDIDRTKPNNSLLGRKNNAKIRKVRNSRAYKGNGLG